ncbi:MAG TPA: ATP-binding protein, partial [Acidilobales archaeon]|nr:ATP-binding protein [Acidilobales archaeon]
MKEINLKVNEALRSIGNVIVVMSGKGGVGKSVISAAISIALTYLKRNVGLLDADIHGPSIPWILGIESKHMYVDDTGKIVPVIAKGGVKVVSIELALE